MTTYVQRAVTEITAEPEPAADNDSEGTPPPDVEEMRRMLANLEGLELRTRACGFND
jgi:hypothetical protein